MQAFLDTYDLLLCPSTIVPPFPVEVRYPTHCAGTEFSSYVDWLLIVGTITLCACPAISIPCGFTQGNMPVGLQIVAPNRGEAKLLAGAAFIEKVLGLGTLTPIEPRVTHET